MNGPSLWINISGWHVIEMHFEMITEANTVHN